MNARDREGRTPLFKAVFTNDLKLVNFLIENGAKVNVRDVNGKTLLHMVGWWSGVKMMKLLIENGADVNAQDKKGTTLLKHLLINFRFGFLEEIKLLIENGADVNAQDKEGNAPLQIAMIEKHFEVVNFLIENGAKVNARDKAGKTLLHIVSHFNSRLEVRITKYKMGTKVTGTEAHITEITNDFKTIKLLIRKGANVNARDRDGNTPLHEACFFKERLQELKRLIKKGAYNTRNEARNTRLLLDSINCHLNVIKLLIKSGANVNARDRNKKTPLHLASDMDQLEIVSLLIKSGVNMNARDVNGETPLHGACYKSQLEVVNCLLKNGANITIKNNRGETPFDVAKKRKSDKIKCQKLFEKIKNQKNNSNKKALHI